MKRIFAMLLAVALAFAGCGGHGEQNPTETQPPAETTPENTVTIPQVTVENPATYFQLSLSYDSGAYTSMTAYEDGQGMVCLEYVGDVKKMVTVDPAVLHAITAELENAGLAALDGENLVGDGFDSASMYVAFADETDWSASYSGIISQAFLDGYEKMDTWFAELLADVPEYVPQPVITGEVDQSVLAEMLDVLKRSGMEPLDMFYISGDAYAAGLSDADGVAGLAECGPVMSSTAYSFVIAAVEDVGDIAGVRQCFAQNLDWNRWICVSANSALIAQKDNMVVCVMGSGDLYADTAFAIENAGWTEIETFRNPGM